MDIPAVLEKLRPGEDWGPCADSSSTYEELRRAWRSGTSVCPTKEEMLAEWQVIQADEDAKLADWRAAKQILKAIPANWKTSADPMKQVAWATQFVFKMVKQGLND